MNEEAPYLKGNDIWDFDKLRVLLDQSPEIRQTYAAWVAPGDVLTKILEQLEPDPPDFERTLSRYLQQELFADQYANLEQAGHNPDERIPMASVFVDLPVSVRGPESADESESFVAGMLEVAYERLSPSCLGQHHRKPTTKPCWRRGLAAPFSSEVPVREKPLSGSLCASCSAQP